MSGYSTYKTIRWFGDNDVNKLSEIRQTDCEGIVTALHHIKIGEKWEVDEINKKKQTIEEAGLSWKVVESLPVHEHIKRRSGRYQVYIENYKQSLANLAECGIEVVTYNFMPVFDWLRTQTEYELQNGRKTLYFNLTHYRIFDLFILKREAALSEYPAEEIARLKDIYDGMSTREKSKLYDSIMLGLPGSSEYFTMDRIRKALEKYKDISASDLQSNLISFLKEIIPTAEKHGIRMAIHPDDPPFSVFGLPRIVSSQSDLNTILQAIDSVYNGLCFCTGSLGAKAENDVQAMFKQFASKINFLHFRNTKREESSGNFIEANHLEGDTDMYAIMKEALILMNAEKRNIPMRPDHGPQMLDDLSKKSYPGYSLIGRMKGLAELRGLEFAIQKELGL